MDDLRHLHFIAFSHYFSGTIKQCKMNWIWFSYSLCEIFMNDYQCIFNERWFSRTYVLITTKYSYEKLHNFRCLHGKTSPELISDI